MALLIHHHSLTSESLTSKLDGRLPADDGAVLVAGQAGVHPHVLGFNGVVDYQIASL